VLGRVQDESNAQVVAGYLAGAIAVVLASVHWPNGQRILEKRPTMTMLASMFEVNELAMGFRLYNLPLK